MEHVDLERSYVLHGTAIAELLQIAYRLSSDMRVRTSERIEMAKQIQTIINQRELA
jgi:hypothetical protein